MNSFREWLNTLFGSDGGRAVQMLFALLLVVLLILAVTWLFRRLFGAALHRGRSNRLSVVDSSVVDQHRRLLLLRRDDVEHLVMVGGPNDLLVESRILKAAPVLAGRAAPTAMPARAQTAAVPPAQAPRDVAAPDAPQALGATDAVRAKAAAGAATVAAAVASAGSLLRARLGRAEEAEPPVRRAPAMPLGAERRTLDDAFDAPLGRPLAEPTDEPRLPKSDLDTFEMRRAAAALAETNFARGAESPLPEPAPESRPAPLAAPSVAPERPAPTMRSIEIDLLADLEAIDAEIPPAPTVASEVRVATAAPIEPTPAVAAPESEPAPEPVAVEEPHFDFDFDLRSEPSVPDEAPRIEIIRSEPDAVAEPDAPIAEAEHEPEPEQEPTISPEPVVEPEPAVEPEAVQPAPPVAPPQPRSAVDELEEEMARLLAELSGQARR